MTDTQSMRFFTPPKLSPLNLDLASLRKRNGWPAQFDGRTHDGREVYCRYRNGWLSVDIAKAVQSDVHSDAAHLLNERIGPSLHASLSIGQLCHYAGISIQGEVPALPTENEKDDDDRPYIDLTGATTYYDVSFAATVRTASSVVDALAKAFSDSYILQINIDTKGDIYKPEDQSISIYSPGSRPTSSYLLLIAGKKPSEKELSRRPPCYENIWQLGTIFEIKFHGFSHKIHPYGKIHDTKHRVAGQVEDCLHNPLRIEATFATDNATDEALVREVDTVLNQYFPTNKIEARILTTGELLPEHYDRPIDRAIVEWIHQSDDHWMHISTALIGDRREYIGYRPAKSQRHFST
ncbi:MULTISPECIES: hypothetical protein [unclassified Beijerinckia]|uniref:hypothetical protein n=1 Tax=unclassified Beijerinckia TaxID=2638183 RepID=UPI0008943A25|nr:MULTISPECIES: hypothetical protein [unclassified Beijerinckia]MDH7794660.1 hypothetical protein [Beijerinckia sp. GAS462]SEB70239.1 hypothetical protein SAMN05443249_0934 [Beijerinckia sp. 28-YEA-48]